MIGDKGMEYLSNSLYKLTKLTELQLDFYETGLTERGAEYISNLLENKQLV